MKEDDGGSRPSRVRRRLAVAGVLTASIGLLWLGLAKGVGREVVLSWALDRFLPPGWDVAVAETRGSWLSPVELHGLEARFPGGRARVDSIRVLYDLTALLRREVRLQELHVHGPWFAQLAQPDPADDSAGSAPASRGRRQELGNADEPSSVGATSTSRTDASADRAPGWVLRLDDVVVDGGSVALRREGGVYRLSGLALAGSARLEAHAGALRIDELKARIVPPAGPVADLELAGSWLDRALVLDRLDLNSERSRVRGRGVIRLPRREPWPGGASDFRLVAEPLDLRDLPLRSTGGWPSTVRGVVHAWTEADTMRFGVDARGSGDETLQVDATLVRRGTPGPAATVSVTARASALPLGFGDGGESGQPRAGVLEADLSGELTALALDRPYAVAGTISHIPTNGSELPPVNARVDVRVEPGREARWRTTTEVAGAVAEGRGRVALTGPDVAIEVEALSFEDVDLSALPGDLPRTRVEGHLGGRIAGGPSGLVGHLALVLHPSTVGPLPVDSARVIVDVARDTLVATVGSRLLGGRLGADFEVTSLAHLPEVRVRLVRFDGLGGSESGTPGLRVTGTARGRAVLSERGPGGRLTVELEPSRLASLEGVNGRATFALDDGIGRVEAGLETPEGGEARLDAVLRGLDRLPPRLADLEGAADLRLGGTLPGGVRVDSTVLALTLDSGRLDLRGLIAPAGVAEGIRLAGEGHVTEESLRFRASARGALPAAGPLLGLPDLAAGMDSIQITTRGILTASEPPRLSVRGRLLGGRWSSLRVDSASASVTLDSAGVQLDTLRVASNVLTLEGGGSLPRASGRAGGVDVRGTLLDLAPLGELTGARELRGRDGSLGIRLQGTLDSLAVATHLRLDAAAYGEVQVRRLDVEGRGTFVPASVQHASVLTGLDGTLDLTLDRIATNTAQVRGVHLTAEGDRDELTVEVAADVDDARRGEIFMRIDPRPERREVRIERLRAQLDEDRWRLGHPAVVSYRRGLAVDSLTLAAGDQRISVEGGLDPDGRVDLVASIDSTDVGTVTDLLGFPGLGGWVQADLQLRGSRDSPSGTLDLAAALGPEPSRRGRTDLSLASDGERIEVDLRLSGTDGEPLTLTGGLPTSLVSLSGADDRMAGSPPLDLRLEADAFGLAWIQAFLDPGTLAELDGVLSVNLTVRGTPDEPRLDGTLSASGLRARLPATGVTWHDGRIRARGRGRELVVEEARFTAGGGRAQMSGTLALEGPGVGMDLDLRLDRFQAVATSRVQARTSGSLRLGGTVREPRVEGMIEVASLDVNLDEQIADDGLEDVELTEADLETLRERFGFVPPSERDARTLADALTADLRIRLGRDSWLRKRASPEMAIAFTGELDVALRPGEDVRADGTVEAIPERGFVEQFGRRFRIVSGTVRLDGPAAEASVDIRASYTIPSHDNPDEAEVTILLDVEGTREDLRLTLSSDPPMENADIVSYVATGRPASGNASFGGAGSDGGLVAAGAGLALDQLTGIIESAAENSVGLDVVEIRREGLREATLAAGKYVTPRIYLGFSQPVSLREGDGLSFGGEGQSEVELEYEALRWLVLNLEASGSAVRFFLRGRRAY